MAIADPPSLFILHGEVRWCQPAFYSGGWRAGLLFCDRSREQAELWRSVIGEIRRARQSGEYAAA